METWTILLYSAKHYQRICSEKRKAQAFKDSDCTFGARVRKQLAPRAAAFSLALKGLKMQRMRQKRLRVWGRLWLWFIQQLWLICLFSTSLSLSRPDVTALVHWACVWLWLVYSAALHLLVLFRFLLPWYYRPGSLGIKNHTPQVPSFLSLCVFFLVLQINSGCCIGDRDCVYSWTIKLLY